MNATEEGRQTAHQVTVCVEVPCAGLQVCQLHIVEGTCVLQCPGHLT